MDENKKTEIKTIPQNNLPTQINMNDMISKVIDKGPDAIAMLEGLLALQERQQKNMALAEFNIAKAKCQKTMPSVKKTREVRGKTGKVTYRYASLDDARRSCLPNICGNGFSDGWKTENQQKGTLITYTVRHDLGHEESTSMFCPMEQSNYMNAIQRSGSTITYGKRYTFCDFWGIVLDEDNDGITSGEKGNQKPQPGKNGWPPKETKLPLRPEAKADIDNTIPSLDSPESWNMFETNLRAKNANSTEMEYFFAAKRSWDETLINDLNFTNKAK